MGHQIVKQPNGKYAVWSTVIDKFIMIDSEPKEIADYFVEREALEIKNRVHDIVSDLNTGKKPYNQFTLSWEDCLNTIEKCYGVEDEGYQCAMRIMKNNP